MWGNPCMQILVSHTKYTRSTFTGPWPFLIFFRAPFLSPRPCEKGKKYASKEENNDTNRPGQRRKRKSNTTPITVGRGPRGFGHHLVMGWTGAVPQGFQSNNQHPKTPRSLCVVVREALASRPARSESTLRHRLLHRPPSGHGDGRGRSQPWHLCYDT